MTTVTQKPFPKTERTKVASRSFTFAVLGYGGRGELLANWVREHPDVGRVVAVAEPDAPRRAKAAAEHGIIDPDMLFSDWRDLLEKPKLADVVINTTMDRLHVASATKALERGYHMILEKPMATSLKDCQAICDADRRSQQIVSVCHSMRYHVVYAKIKSLFESGVLGDMVSFDQLEAVEPIHHSHSFVRANWGNESRSTFMLLAKSCHDIDVLAYLVNQPCLRVSSFGSLMHFRKENAPPGSPLRCTDGCPVEATCSYAAQKIYLSPDSPWADIAKMGSWTQQQKLDALKHGPLGQCVYHCDNDVVDHQVVNFEFKTGITGTFTMTAFAHPGGRYLRLHGTKGYLTANLLTNEIDLYRFNYRPSMDQKTAYPHERFTLPKETGGHGGADSNMMEGFIEALRLDDPSYVLTSTEDSLVTHRITFAAELARQKKRVVELSELF